MLTKEEIRHILENKKDVIKVIELEKHAPYSIFEFRQVKDIQNDIISYISEKLQSNGTE